MKQTGNIIACMLMFQFLSCKSIEMNAQAKFEMSEFSIVATSEAVGLPFTNYLPYHPGLEVKL